MMKLLQMVLARYKVIPNMKKLLPPQMIIKR